MDLLTFCEKQGGTGRRGCPVLLRIAGDTGFSPETLYMVARGHKRAGHVMAREIARSTKDAVTREDLRSDIFGDPVAAEGEGA